MRRNVVIFALFAPLLSFLLSASGCSKTPEDAVKSFKKGDYKTAYKVFKTFAEKGDVTSQFHLGEMYKRGLVVPQDDAKAIQWYLKAAEQGQPNAQNNLGVMYFRSQSIKPDYVQAYMWLTVAASNLTTAKERETAEKNKDIIASSMTPGQIAEAQRLAQEWKPKKDSVVR